VPFIQPTKILFADHREIQLLSRDISPTGIRLIGTPACKVKKVRVIFLGQDNGQGMVLFGADSLGRARSARTCRARRVFLELLDPHH